MLSPISHPILKHYTLFHLWKLNFLTNILCSEWHLVWVQIHPFFHLWKWEILRKIFGLKWHLIWVQIHQLLLAKTCVFAQHIGSKMVSHMGARTPFSNFWKKDIFFHKFESKMIPDVGERFFFFTFESGCFCPKYRVQNATSHMCKNTQFPDVKTSVYPKTNMGTRTPFFYLWKRVSCPIDWVQNGTSHGWKTALVKTGIFFTKILGPKMHLIWVQNTCLFYLQKCVFLITNLGPLWHLICVKNSLFSIWKTCVFVKKFGSKLVPHIDRITPFCDLWKQFFFFSNTWSKMASHMGEKTPILHLWKRVFLPKILGSKWRLIWVKITLFPLVRTDAFAQNFVPKWHLIWVQKHLFSTRENGCFEQDLWSKLFVSAR